MNSNIKIKKQPSQKETAAIVVINICRFVRTENINLRLGFLRKPSRAFLEHRPERVRKKRTSW